MNPEINEYVKLTRRLYPFADVHVVTNALLLMKMPDEFFNTVRECDTVISISFYLPIVNKKEAIVNFLEHKRVKYLFNQPLAKQFYVNTSLTPNNNAEKMFYDCPSTNCRNLWDSKIAVCYKSSAIKIFNDYFNTHLPEKSGLIDLYDETLTTEKLKRQLFEPFELCRYCTPSVFRDWGIISYPASINDWLAN